MRQDPLCHGRRASQHFVLGDWIQVGSRLGKIAQIRWRSTSILTREGDSVIIPNAQLLSNEVLNFSRPTVVHRVSLRVSFHFRHPPNEVKKTMLDALSGVPELLREPAPECAPAEFSGQTITYSIRYSITEVAAETRVEGEVRTRIWYAAERAGLEGPCPAKSATVDATELAERVAALGKITLFQPLEPAERKKLDGEAKGLRFAVGSGSWCRAIQGIRSIWCEPAPSGWSLARGTQRESWPRSVPVISSGRCPCSPASLATPPAPR